MELKAQFRGDVGVRLLLERENNIEADALGADIVRSAIGGYLWGGQGSL